MMFSNSLSLSNSAFRQQIEVILESISTDSLTFKERESLCDVHFQTVWTNLKYFNKIHILHNAEKHHENMKKINH